VWYSNVEQDSVSSDRILEYRLEITLDIIQVCRNISVWIEPQAGKELFNLLEDMEAEERQGSYVIMELLSNIVTAS